MQKGKKQYRPDEYTKKATVVLRAVEESKALSRAIWEGDRQVFDRIMRHSVDHQLTFGDHIKRYIYDCTEDGGRSIDEMTWEEVTEFILNAFKDNGMKNRGSVLPETKTSLKSQLNRWLQKPAYQLKRETCFLFAFGLNMDEEQTSYFLNYVFRKADFDVRDPDEAIYYYCLRKNLKYSGMVQLKEKYASLPQICGKREERTEWLRKELMMSMLGNASENEFLEYLQLLKSLPDTKKKSKTRADVFRELLCEMNHSLWAERVNDLYLIKKNTLDFLEPERRLLAVPTEGVELPESLDLLMREDRISIPSFSGGTLEKKISERTIEIKREDILMVTFLLEACMMGDSFCETKPRYQERRSYFEYEANYNLKRCGFGELYLLNPFELFLVSCLLQEKPMEYFLAAWKKYRRERDGKHEDGFPTQPVGTGNSGISD